MKKLVIFLLLSLVHVARAQDGNIPTLESKMLKGEITMIEYFQFKNDPEAKEYMQRTQVSREYYDNTGKLIKKEDEGGGKKLRAEYIPNKKGKLKEVRHVDLFTGDVFKTTVYTYKKGNLFSIAEKTDGVTTKVELKRNKKGEVIQKSYYKADTLTTNEFYDYDEQGRVTHLWYKAVGEPVRRLSRAFVYEDRDSLLRTITYYQRVSDSLKITTDDIVETKRQIFRAMGSSKKATSDLVTHTSYEDDESGNWIKAEVVNHLHERTNLVFRKIHYADGRITGRSSLGKNDHVARFFKAQNGTYLNLDGKSIGNEVKYVKVNGTRDWLAYHGASQANIVLKGWEDYGQTSWREADVLTYGEDKLLWKHDISFNVFYKGLSRFVGARYDFQGDMIFYDNSKGQSFLAKDYKNEYYDKHLGIAEPMDGNVFWYKTEGTKYITIRKGKTITGVGRLDGEGNGIVDYEAAKEQYFLKNFTEAPYQQLFTAVVKPLSLEVTMEDVDGGLLYSKETREKEGKKSGVFWLKTQSGRSLQKEVTTKSPYKSESRYVYYPPLNAWIEMTDYEKVENVKDAPARLVTAGVDTVCISSSGKWLWFYAKGERIVKKSASYTMRLEGEDLSRLLIYDSAANKSFSTSYPKGEGVHISPMSTLPKSYGNAYIFKYSNGNATLLVKGTIIEDEAHTAELLDNDLLYLTGDANNTAYLTKGFVQAKAGDFIVARQLSEEERKAYLDRIAERQNKAAASSSSQLNYPEITRPKDDWMQRIDNCGKNEGCIAQTIAQMGEVCKKAGWTKEKTLATMVPYFVAIADQDKKLLHSVTMKVDEAYLGVINEESFPKELKQYIREESQRIVNDYVKKNGAPQIKTLPYKKKN